MALLSPAEVGDLIRAARREKGLSQRQLAGRMGTNQSCISHWELGTRTPSRPSLARLAAHLDLRIDALLVG